MVNPSRYYLHTPELELLAETEQSANASKPIAWSYLWFGGVPVAQVDAANTIRWYATDHLGTPFLQTSADGTVVWRAEYAPFGEVFAYREGAALHQPLRFPGQVAVDSGELYYNIFRWYRGGWGRYTQPDPMGLHGGLNIYGYTKGNPVVDLDPLGLCCSSGDFANQLAKAKDIASKTTDTNFFQQFFTLKLWKSVVGVMSEPTGCGLNADTLVKALNGQLTCWNASRVDAGPKSMGYTCQKMFPVHSIVQLTPVDKCCGVADPGKQAIDNYWGEPKTAPFPDQTKYPF